MLGRLWLVGGWVDRVCWGGCGWLVGGLTGCVGEDVVGGLTGCVGEVVVGGWVV